MVWLLAALTLAAQATGNRIVIPDVTTPAATAFQLPVQLNNADQIVAAQFTITMPEGVTLTTDAITATERVAGHQVVVREISSNTYMVMLYSSTNAAIAGHSGTLFTIAAQAGALDEGSEHPMKLTDVVLSDATGKEVSSTAQAGRIIISGGPDLTVTDVSANKTTIAPGDQLTVAWTVTNIGPQATGGGWSERLSLVTADGATKHLTSIAYDNTLAASKQVKRTANMQIPSILGLDGKVMLQVQLVPNDLMGESTAKLDNNTAHSGELTLGKTLTMQLNPNPVAEANGTSVKGLLTRSGDWSRNQVFTLTHTTDTRVSMPKQVTIAAGQASERFYLNLTANGTLDDNEHIIVQATGGGYDAAADTLEIVDDVFPSLHIESSKRDINEGDSFELHVHVDKAPTHDVLLNLQCDYAAMFRFPSQVTLPAGQKAIDIPVASIDDDAPYLNQTATFLVSAMGYVNDEAYVTVADNDIPEIELTLTPTTVNENAGPTAINARLHRVGEASSKITIKLSDDSDGSIIYPTQSKSLTLNKGVTTADFSLGVVDNAIVDGDRTVNITAAVYIASCSCQATGDERGAVTVPVTIIDNDGPALELKSSLSTVLEGGSTVITVRSNTTDAKALSVTLSSNADDALDYPHTVTIPAGEASAEVTIAVRSNSVAGDSRVVELKANAEGYTVGTTWFLVSDQTLPDAVVRNVAVAESEIYVGDEATLTITLANEGASPIPSQTLLSVYVDQACEATAEIRLAEALATGGELTLTRTIALPAVPGSHTIKVTANPIRAFSELSYTNNEAVTTVEVLPQFAVAVTADKKAYTPGETVTLSGRATGKLIGNQEIEVYVMGNGLRQTVSAVTDATGNLTATWTPQPNQMGHFTAGACYPGEMIKDAQTEFDVYGLMLTDRYQTAQMTVGEPFTGTITVSNKCSQPQSGITATVVDGADNIEAQFTTVSTIAAGGFAAIKFTLNATAPTDNSAPDLYNGWQPVKLQITDEQGAATDYTLYCYAASPRADLKPSLTQIKTTVPKDGTHDIEFTLHNVGRGASGAIELSLPPYITLLTPATMPSLDFDESATVALRLSAPDGMKLSQIMKGTLGINCAGGTGLAMPFEFELVSDAVGTLTVDVTDEYTYYTEEAPHVAGATVTIQHPVTNAIVAQGETDANGHFTVQLNEGYYNVTVTKASHDSATKTVLIDPGREKTETILISISGVEITYEVVETDEEDVYDIKTTYVFETNVPIPVVTVDVPSSLDGESLAVGESLMFDVVITNRGLITAKDVELTLPEDPEFTFIALETDAFDLAANQSKVIKVLMTRTEVTMDSRKRAAGDVYWHCFVPIITIYRYQCDSTTNWKWVKVPVFTKVLGRTCEGSIGGDLSDFGRLPIGWPPPPITVPGWLTKFSDWILKGSKFNCKPCSAKEYLEKTASCLINFIPGAKWVKVRAISCVRDLWNCFKPSGTFWEDNAENQSYCIGKIVTCVTSAALEVLKKSNVFTLIGLGLLDCINEFFIKPCEGNKNDIMGVNGTRTASSNNYPDYIVAFQEHIAVAGDGLNACLGFYNEYFGDECWLNADAEQVNQFFLKIDDSLSADGKIKETKMADIVAARPENVSEQQAMALIERLNNTLAIAAGNDASHYTNCMNIERMDELMSIIDLATVYAQKLGYEDLSDFMVGEVNKVIETSQKSENSNSVCSTITLEFKQTLTLTRQGFLGTLTVKNNHESNAIDDFQLHLEVRDPEGNLAGADKMEIHTEKLTGFTGDLQLGSDWSLASGTTGVATVKYIPTDKAAPEHDLDYTFGGTVTFVDPYTGLTVSRDLTPKTLTVRPAPQLYLDYFMQRDVLGDDPLTADVVEPSLPAEFALLINNRGAGDANNMKITTAQPEITENEKGLLIDMALFNGKDASLVMSDKYVNDFGTIAAGDHALAQWYLRSSLLGHFISYDVEVNHVTGFDNPDLSLVKDAQVHELIHECGDATGQVAFLVNDDVDANDTPDHLYALNGEAATVAATATLQATRQGETKLLLTLNGAAQGWNYANAIDPTMGLVRFEKVVRQSDGTVLPPANVWLTDRTLRDGRDPLYENRIHLVDQLAASGNECYEITVTPMAQPILEVESISGMETTKMNLQAVTTATVRFNKAIDVATFTTADITLLHEGVKQDASKIVISAVGDREFALDLSALTTADGYYVLTVATIGITDAEGYNGINGKMVGWLQRVEGTVAYKVNINPTGGGEVSSLAGTVPAGSELTLTATPVAGYSFAGWFIDGELVSDNDSCGFTLDAALTTIEARFGKTIYDVAVSVAPEDGGLIEGDGNGKYTYGDVLHITATPAKYHEFAGWTVNGKDAGNDSMLELNVTENATVVAHFTAIERVTIDYALNTGWNWVSFGVDDESMLDLNDALGSLYSARALRGPKAQATHSGRWTGEIMKLSPELAYKLQMVSPGTLAITGEPIADFTMTLQPGWNWMGYLPTDELAVTEALALVPAEAGDVLKGQDAFVLFDGEQWLGDLTAMKPGLGYMYYSKSTKSFGFPMQHMASHSRVKAAYSSDKTDAPWQYDPYKYANNMVLTAVISKMTLSEGSWIGAFVGEECRGAASITNGVFYLTVHGDNDGDELTFKLYDPKSGTQELKSDSIMTFVDDNAPTANDPIVLAGKNTAIDDVHSLGEIRIHPVPVTDRLYFDGITHVDWLVIHGISGRQMMKITNSNVRDGIDVSQLAGGMYVITINGDNRQWNSVFIKE